MMNACEVFMIVSAAARGISMFKYVAHVHEETIRALAKRKYHCFGMNIAVR